jgi:hypothetical protein
MALTTASQQEYSIPTKPQKISQEAAILLDKSIVARPLSAPEVASIHVKNTEFYYRWVNRLHSNGRVYMERKAMGFVNATNDDVDVLVGDTISTDSEIRCGDVILMKIPFHLWASHVKRNMEVAKVLQSMRGVHNKEEDLSPDVFSEGGRPRHESVKNDLKSTKISSFIPDNPDAFIDGQSPADTEKVKAQVETLRRKHAAERSK